MILKHSILCHIMPCHTILHNTIKCQIIPYYNLLQDIKLNLICFINIYLALFFSFFAITAYRNVSARPAAEKMPA